MGGDPFNQYDLKGSKKFYVPMDTLSYKKFASF